MSDCRWMTTWPRLTGSLKAFLYSSVYSCQLFLISSASIRPFPFFVLCCTYLCMTCPLVSLIFLARSLVFPILLFYSISLHWSIKKALLFLLAIFLNSAFTWIYLSLSPVPFASHLSSAIDKASSDNHFAFFHCFFLGMVLVITFCTMLQTSVHNSSGTLCTWSRSLNLFITSTV